MQRFECACHQSCAWFTIDLNARTGFWSAVAACLHCGEQTVLGGGTRKEAELVLSQYRELQCPCCSGPIETTQLWGTGVCGSCIDREVREDGRGPRRRYRRRSPDRKRFQ